MALGRAVCENLKMNMLTVKYSGTIFKNILQMKAAVVGKYRWTICALIFFSTTINYLDRAVISLLKDNLETTFRWKESDYANIVISFQAAYAIGMLIIGRLIDKVGTKAGYAIAVLLWSMAAMGHALVRSITGFVIARAGLGVSEAGNFPAAIKTVAEWFPRRERAFATGVFNSGANIGAIIAPLTVPWIAVTWGWQYAFIITGVLGLIWVLCWLVFYEIPLKQRKLSKAELNLILNDTVEFSEGVNERYGTDPRLTWMRLLGFKQTWAFVLGKFLTDPVWWFYLFWLPAFLTAQYGISGTQLMIPVALVYTLSTFGGIAGGYLPLYLIKRGQTLFSARKISMLVYAVCALPVVLAQVLGGVNIWATTLIIGLAASAHQAWSANIFTTVSDMFPKKAVASVTGIGGMAGAIGGILMAKGTGTLFDYFKTMGRLEIGYYIMFFICGLAYILAWFIIYLLVPKMQPINM